MRTIKQLLQLMLDNKHLFKYGLCAWSRRIGDKNIISDDEDVLLIRYIEKNRPSKFSSIEAYKSKDSVFYWEKENITPRIKWIKKHIKKNN